MNQQKINPWNGDVIIPAGILNDNIMTNILWINKKYINLLRQIHQNTNKLKSLMDEDVNNKSNNIFTLTSDIMKDINKALHVGIEEIDLKEGDILAIDTIILLFTNVVQQFTKHNKLKEFNDIMKKAAPRTKAMAIVFKFWNDPNATKSWKYLNGETVKYLGIIDKDEPQHGDFVKYMINQPIKTYDKLMSKIITYKINI